MPDTSADDPIRWTLPPFTTHTVLFAEQLDSVLPYHITDAFIDKYVWPKDDGSVKVGIVDTGASLGHPELEGKLLNAEDFTGNQRGPSDGNGHGSHVAGLVSAKSFGVHKNGKLVIAKGLSDNGTGSDQTLSKAIKYCGDQGCRVINLSAGSNVRSPAISGILKELAQQGCLICVAAGNDGGTISWPAQEEFVFAVTALNRDRTLASFSNRGAAADVAAYGVEIRSLGRGGTYAVLSGTSMSTPIISGYIAAWASYRLSTGKSFPTFNETMEWLGKTSTDLGAPGRDWEFGLGLPNAKDGFEDVAISPPQPTAPPIVTEPVVTPSGQPSSIIVTMPSGKQFMYRDGKAI